MVTDIHQAVINLAKELGVILADRNASLSWMYDGKSVALWHQCLILDNYDREDANLNFGGEFPKRIFASHDILHELGHFIAAQEVQREFPEFGLDWGVTVSQALGPLGSPYRTADGRPTWTYEEAGYMRLLDEEEADIQEFFAQQFCVAFGKRHGVPSQMLGTNLPEFNTWNGYLAYKRQENGDRAGWFKASQRLAKYLEGKPTPEGS